MYKKSNTNPKIDLSCLSFSFSFGVYFPYVESVHVDLYSCLIISRDVHKIYTKFIVELSSGHTF